MADNNITHRFLSLADSNAPFRDELIDAASRVIASGIYVGGPEVKALEDELAALCSVPHAVCVSNGLDALRLILKAYIHLGRLEPGDEIIIPDMTFVATALAVVDAGLVPVPVDIDPQTLNLDSSRLEDAITPRTRGVMPVHLYGRVCCDDALLATVGRHNLIMIEDAAQAIGARSLTPGLYGTTAAGSLGHAAALSFYPTKNIGALGDAGAVLTHDHELAEAVRTIANYGYGRHYINVCQGYNCRMDAIQAAMLRVKLPYTARENDYRIALARAYDALLDNPLIVKPEIVDGHVFHQYAARIVDPAADPADTRRAAALRDAFRAHMLAGGVETSVHYPRTIHSQPCFPGLNALRIPVAEAVAATEVSLPIARTTPLEQIGAIAAVANSFRG